MRRPGAAALMTVLAAGCASTTAAYRPDPAAPAIDSEGVRLQVAAVAVRTTAPGVAVTIDMDAGSSAARPVTLEAARLAPAGAPACEGGLPAGIVWSGADQRWERPLAIAGRQRLTLDFPVPTQESGGEEPRAPFTTIDLLLSTAGGSRCVHVPLPPAHDLRKRSAWSWGGSFRLDPPFLSAASGVMRLGRWIGPVRVGAELGVGARRCDDCVSVVFFGVPTAVTVEVMPATSGGLGLGVEAAYVAEPWLGRPDGDRYFVMGPRATLRVSGTAPRTPDHPGGPALHDSSIDLWLARWTSPGVPHWSQVAFGVGWTWDNGL